MKTIGLIGGMSWESSIEYYRLVNETVKEKLGELHSAKSVMYSVDFAEVELLQRQGRWDEATRMMVEAARQVERGGGEFLIICANTMHKMADQVQAAIGIPLLHIADVTAEKVREEGIECIGLLGTRFTMEEDFYKGRLADKYHLKVVIPEPPDRETVHRVIYDELVCGQIKADSKSQYTAIMDRLVKNGAQGIILGCTEIGLLVQQADSRVPLFDTTRIHAIAAAEYALES